MTTAVRAMALAAGIAVALVAAPATPAAAQETVPGTAPGTAPVTAQEGRGTAAAAAPYEPVGRDAVGTRLVDMPTPYTTPRRALEILFTHRFQQPVDEGDESNLWGLDGGADIGIGLAYGLTDHLEVSLFRSSFQENFELAGKFLILEQAPAVPLTVGVRAGADLLRRDGVADPERPFAQLLLSRRFGSGFNLLLAPSYVRDTPRLRDAFNVPIGLTIALPRRLLLELEVVPANRDLDASELAWHVALSKAVGGHIFEWTFGNSRATTVDQMLGGDFAGGFAEGDVRLGFNLVRNVRF